MDIFFCIQTLTNAANLRRCAGMTRNALTATDTTSAAARQDIWKTAAAVSVSLLLISRDGAALS